MRISENLAALALRQVIGGTCKAIGIEAGEGAVAGVVGFLTRHFSDHSQRLTDALAQSIERAWKALEVALAGDSLWDSCKLVLARGEDKAFRDLVQPFLASCPLAILHGRDSFRRLALAELHTARKEGVLKTEALEPGDLARRVSEFARFSDPQGMLTAELDALADVGSDLRRAGYENLGEFVALQPPSGQPLEPLLLLAARYFFRRAVENDPALFQGLTFARMEKLQADQEAGFDSLLCAVSGQAANLELLLDDLQVVVVQTRDAVLDVRAEQSRQGQQSRDIYQAVIDLQSRLDQMNQPVRPRDSLSLRNDTERSLVKHLVARYRSLPETDRQTMPALLNAIGKLEVAAGDFTSARADFVAVSTLARDTKAKAEAHFNAYRAALEARDWPAALGELREAATLDAARFAPFPMDKYRPQQILGAGGFGTAFLCEHRFLKMPVVVKTLSDDDLEQGIDTVFGEAQALRQLDHPSIIRLQDCGFGSPDGESRPYLVMDFFEGKTLEEAVRERPLPVEEMLPVAHQIASGLVAAHGKSILHRDVKPANVLVRRDADGWQTRLIDFGLALRRTGRETMLASTHTILGSSIAGTLDYAAPEQMGKLAGVNVSPASDVFGFARTCCHALFQTPQPLMRHWRLLPADFAELLESCLEEQPPRRPQGFGEVLAVLDRLLGTTSASPAAALTTAEEPRRRELAVLAQQVAGCTRCSALARSRQHTVSGTGPVSADICFIGEAPGADEDRTGQPFVGAAGQVLTGLLGEVGLDRSRVFITNLIRCRPPGNRKPEPQEMQNCREHLLRELDQVRPKAIVCLGASAAQGLLGTTESIGRLRGRIHLFRGTPVVCTYHPAFLLPGRSPEKRRDVVADIRLVQQQAAKA